MGTVLLDTNALIWYFSQPQLPSTAGQHALQTALRDGQILVASISLVELIYLVDKNRIPAELLAEVEKSFITPTSGLVFVDLGREIAQSVALIPRTTVPDMPDRIIAATALHLNVPLISSDSRVRQLKNVETVW